jgi:hypothetical protein
MPHIFTLRLCLILRYLIKSALIIENADGFCKPVLPSPLPRIHFSDSPQCIQADSCFTYVSGADAVFSSTLKYMTDDSIYKQTAREWLLGSLTCVRVQKKQLFAWTDNSGKYRASTEVVKWKIKRDFSSDKKHWALNFNATGHAGDKIQSSPVLYPFIRLGRFCWIASSRFRLIHLYFSFTLHLEPE